jgi:hypothetical protein
MQQGRKHISEMYNSAIQIILFPHTHTWIFTEYPIYNGIQV